MKETSTVTYNGISTECYKNQEIKFQRTDEPNNIVIHFDELKKHHYLKDISIEFEGQFFSFKYSQTCLHERKRNIKLILADGRKIINKSYLPFR